MFAEPEFWVAVGFVILMIVFAYVGVHRTVLTALDHRRRLETPSLWSERPLSGRPKIMVPL